MSTAQINSWINQKNTIKRGKGLNSLAQVLNYIKYETDTVKVKIFHHTTKREKKNPNK